MSNFLQTILEPRSIAVVGASNNPTKRGYHALKGLIDDGFSGDIYPVNPRAGDILGLKSYPSLESVPGEIDLAVSCVPAKFVADVIGDAGLKKVGGVVILASGFGEMGAEGRRLEQQIKSIANACSVRLIGPNTSGLFNLHHNINLLGLKGVKPGTIGFISQSGNMLLSLALEAQANGHLGFSCYVGPGNQIDVGFSDYLRFLGEDINTKVAAFYIEGFNNGEDFLQAAQEVTPNKPVVVYKSGSTEAGVKSACSHTGALAGSYAMTADVLAQAGIIVVERSDLILPVAETLELQPPARGKRVAILADGGGQATIAADRVVENDLEFAQLCPATQEALAGLLWPQATLSNPVDVAGSTDADPGLFAHCIDILLADKNVDIVLVVGMFGGYSARFGESFRDVEIQTAKRIGKLVQQHGKPIVVHSLYSPLKTEALQALRMSGIPNYASIEVSVSVVSALCRRGLYLQSIKRLDKNLPLDVDHFKKGHAIIKQGRVNNGNVLLENEAKALLTLSGIMLPEEILVKRASELDSVAQQFSGQAVAMKIVSKDILHKSDAGGVKLNLRTVHDYHAAYDTIIANAKIYNINADITGVLVAPMAKKGVEIIIGMVNDPIFGSVLMLGLGGIFVEVLKDVTFRKLPLSRYDAESMLGSIKAKKILSGVRGMKGVDRSAIIELLLKVSSLISAYPEIAELDLNPVIAYSDGYAVVDARVILQEE
jgi:acetyltransferase